jgi:putative AdoMet-dependent methyltransferase
MMAQDRSEEARLFDEWADRYDETVRSSHGFPFDGYDATLARVAALADVEGYHRVLDLGIGTGNLATRLADSGCEIWGLDISPKMLRAAQAKLPRARLVQGDVTAGWPSDLPERFDRMVSAYVFHHFDLDAKVELLTRLVRGHCSPGGRVVVGDISFPTASKLLEAGREWGQLMDPEEYYWIADEAIDTCEQAGLRVEYEEVSAFAGVFLLEDGAGTLAKKA